MSAKNRRSNANQQFTETMQSAAKFLSSDDGPNIAVVEFGGWDTHANQGSTAGALAGKFSALDKGLTALQRDLKTEWNNTVVVVATEFGRTVHVNGTRGTDHGTGTAALLLGGAVNGGKVIADWPGLAKKNLYAGRDLQPTSDIRSLFKGVLADHLGIAQGHLENVAFPNSRSAVPMQDLIAT
jgi:uncharacterized protein (DUF1501 family)